MLFFSYCRIHLKAIAEYRSTFFAMTVGQFFTSLASFAAMAFLFSRFGSVGGWDFSAACLCFSVSLLGFSFAECFVRGFDTFSSLIVSGDFDRLLVRPRSTVLQVIGSKIEFSRLGRLTQAALIFAYSLHILDITWTPGRALVLLGMVLGAAAVFSGIFIAGASLCFITVEGLEVVNILTDGGRELLQYPLDIYGDGIRRFFTYVLPYGLFNYLPLSYITGRTDALFNLAAPYLSLLFLLPCLLLWRAGVRRYLSTGN